MGGPGTGKSVFALQTLVGAASKRKQSGIFVAFEENIDAIFANAAAFDWGLPALARKRLFFMNAQLSPAFVATGDFDLGGMLAMLEAKQLEIGAQWVVFDGIDVLLSLLRTPRAKMREIYRLRDWLTRRELTAIITTKIDGEGASADAANYGFMQFMVDCVVRFDRRMEQGIPVRRLEISKYRGSAFAPGEFPLSFGPHGMEVASPGATDIPQEASTERVSTGFAGLDQDAGRRPVPRQQHADHRRARHFEDHAGGTVRRKRLPARRAHAVRELRRGRRARPAQSQVGRHSSRRAREVRPVADVFGPHRLGEPRRAPDPHRRADRRAPAALHGHRSVVGHLQDGSTQLRARHRQPSHLQAA